MIPTLEAMIAVLFGAMVYGYHVRKENRDLDRTLPHMNALPTDQFPDKTKLDSNAHWRGVERIVELSKVVGRLRRQILISQSALFIMVLLVLAPIPLNLVAVAWYEFLVWPCYAVALTLATLAWALCHFSDKDWTHVQTKTLLLKQAKSQ